jgi:hypothetical protein
MANRAHSDLDVVGEIDVGNAILFLGSGFSLKATNVRNETPPNGQRLRAHFIKAAGLPDDTKYNFQAISDDFHNRDAEKMHRELYEIFHIKENSSDQKLILSHEWRRLYTTNYDDSVELFRINNKLSPNTFDITERVPNRLPKGSVVHLHGSIRNVTRDNVIGNIILGESSYVETILTRSPWYDQLQHDLLLSSAIFIVGYNFDDYHIASVFMADPKLAEKTFFIQPDSVDDFFLRRTENYGRTISIGVDRFAKGVSQIPKPKTVLDHRNLRSFRSLSPDKDKKGVVQPTATEVFDFLIYGQFDTSRLFRSLPGDNYAAPRQDLVRSAVEELEKTGCLVVDGRIGNGKTVFLSLLSFELASLGYSCYEIKSGASDVSSELEFLSSQRKVAIFVTNYAEHQDIIKELRSSVPDAKILVEIRTSILEVRFHEISKVLPREFRSVSVNTLDKEDRVSLEGLCVTAGATSLSAARNPHFDLREILLQLLNSETIRDRIHAAMQPLFSSTGRRRLIVSALLLSTRQIIAPSSFLRSVTTSDPFNEFKPVEELAQEVFDLSSGHFGIRSSVLAQFLVDTFVDADEIFDCLRDMILSASDRKSDRGYRHMLSSLMAYGNLKRDFSGHSDALIRITALYEKVRHDERVNSEPLFWLQYAIACSDIPRLDMSWAYIQAAYRRAEMIPGYETFQIDTQACRIALALSIEQPPGQPISLIQDILDLLDRVNSMISEESHRTYAVRVLEGLEQLCRLRGRDLSLSEANALVFWMNTLLRSLDLMPHEFKLKSDSEKARQAISNAITALTR